MPAKPYNYATISSPLCETFSFTQSMSECTRKRKRQSENDDDSQDFDPSGSKRDDNNKTRRINPFKLAERLPDGLVEEMETFIKPGAIMPNFEIRKELQIRYQVDRRHLYDYFHSRGLRVAKEDRHSNLTRSRIAKKAQTGVKENANPKVYKPIKLPPAQRSTTKYLPKSVKKLILAPVIDDSVPSGSNSSAYNQEQDAASVSRAEHRFVTDAALNDRQSVAALNISSADVDTAIDAATQVADSPIAFYEDSHFSSGRSTPALVSDSASSSCRSPSPEELVYPEEEPFSPAEFAAEFLNLPEDTESSSSSFMDSIVDFSSTPSMIGNLMSSSDRKSMYNQIDTTIVSTGYTLPLDFPALSLEKTNFETLFPSTTVPSFVLPPTFESRPEFNLGMLLSSTSTKSECMDSVVSTALGPSPLTDSCVPPAEPSYATRVFTPSDFVTTGVQQHAAPVPVSQVYLLTTFPHMGSFHPGQSPLGMFTMGGGF